ncbi:MAG: diol dehydratase small subunit [Caldilineaceae bacterium]|nr:diol dehydratase small subunit [Caldilineaceae bacterium]
MQYPLGDDDGLPSASGKTAGEIGPEALAAGALGMDDLQIDAATLRAQAEIARMAGYPQLAQNLTRAAELTAVPNATLLTMYETLRPGRATHAELLALAETLEAKYAASVTAALVREAAEQYRRRGLCKS